MILSYDKDQDTGVHARGGSNTIDTDKVASIDQLLDSDMKEINVCWRKIESNKVSKKKATKPNV